MGKTSFLGGRNSGISLYIVHSSTEVLTDHLESIRENNSIKSASQNHIHYPSQNIFRLQLHFHIGF